MKESFLIFCQWLADTILLMGYPGIVFLMAIESSVIPLPSELVMPPAGFHISEGNMSWVPVIVAGTLGSLIGASINYFVSLYLGRPLLMKYGKYFFVNQKSLETSDKFFLKHGEIATFIGRLIPGVRHLISIPAGLSKMNYPRFAFYTVLGSSIWMFVLTLIGYLVGRNKDLVTKYMHEATLWTFAALSIIIFIYIKFQKTRNKKIFSNS